MTTIIDPATRFARHYTVTDDGCWRWTSGVNWGGYSKFWFCGRTVSGHRWSYEYFVGPIDDGLTIDHLCRNRRCVNPDHLEAVTMRENVLRGNTVAAINTAKTICPQGHPYSHRNINGDRMCRICQNVAARKSQKAARLRGAA